MPRNKGLQKRKAMRRKRKRTWLKEHCRQWVRNLRHEGGEWELAASGSDSGEETDDESYDSGLESDDDVEATSMEVRVVLLPPKDPLQSERKTLVDELCSEKNRLGPNEAVTYLIYLFSQTDTSSRILRELLREQAIMDLSIMIEGLMDFFRIPGYDYPEECRDGIVAIGGPEIMLWDKWADWRHDWIRFHRLRLVPWRALVFKGGAGTELWQRTSLNTSLRTSKWIEKFFRADVPFIRGSRGTTSILIFQTLNSWEGVRCLRMKKGLCFSLGGL